MAKHKTRTIGELRDVPVEHWTLNEIREQARLTCQRAKGTLECITILAETKLKDEDARCSWDQSHDKDYTEEWKTQAHKYRTALKCLLSELEAMGADLFSVAKIEGTRARVARRALWERTKDR